MFASTHTPSQTQIVNFFIMKERSFIPGPLGVNPHTRVSNFGRRQRFFCNEGFHPLIWNYLLYGINCHLLITVIECYTVSSYLECEYNPEKVFHIQQCLKFAKDEIHIHS